MRNNNKKIKKRILVDMSVTILHYGHIRLLKKAAAYGDVIVGLSSDNDIKKFKGYIPELNYAQRKEIVGSIQYVKEVVKVNFNVSEEDLKKNKIDLLIHGNDLKNIIDKKKVKILKRTKNISSTELRKKSYLIYKFLNKNEKN
jgi:cytidyltransferase-like protein